MLAVGQNKLSVPKFAKRAVEVSVVIALTAAVALAIIVSNNVLMPRGSASQGFNLWLAFVKRSDVFGTIALTALVAAIYLSWARSRERR
ncbi:MAG TPA: hypothetical protein VG900_03860 [Hyphomicrobiaceae bacterium]|nr:hypothetical protein [Hyphomicrobiaceae bacterium]